MTECITVYMTVYMTMYMTMRGFVTKEQSAEIILKCVADLEKTELKTVYICETNQHKTKIFTNKMKSYGSGVDFKESKRPRKFYYSISGVIWYILLEMCHFTLISHQQIMTKSYSSSKIHGNLLYMMSLFYVCSPTVDNVCNGVFTAVGKKILSVCSHTKRDGEEFLKACSSLLRN
ncbi:hypothetical protein EB796_001019 [Bugula neritina]|uniref:Uncharacterized protein n=1 Tax=Bugula neritina TaxID=10212 RepID=A0A7J7KR68_BUGNE|nr:hypothetical protein EB796_001019 [Bugula neritina]